MGIADAKIEEKDVSFDDIKMNLPKALMERLQAAISAKKNVIVHSPIKNIDIRLSHKANGIDPVFFDFEDEESAGTRRFFALAGPWTDILDKGYTVFIDEMETSLHPQLIREMLKLLFSDVHNSKGAQVVFATHNPLLLDTTLLRRDQIWFTEKAPAGTTHLYPLTDYQPRKDEALAKGYLAGRYGAIPFIPEGLQL